MTTDQRNLNEIIKDFNSTVKVLLLKLEKKSRNEMEVANLKRLKQRISLLKSGVGEHALLHEAYPFFIQFRDDILDRERYEHLVLNVDVRAEYLKKRSKIKPEDEFAFNLTDSIREHYNKTKTIEKDGVYLDVKKIFNCCIEYAILQT